MSDLLHKEAWGHGEAACEIRHCRLYWIKWLWLLTYIIENIVILNWSEDDRNNYAGIREFAKRVSSQ